MPEKPNFNSPSDTPSLVQMLDSAPIHPFDNLSSIAARLCHAEFAHISFFDAEKEIIKSHFGPTLNLSKKENIFYSDFPIINSSGQKIGILSVMDYQINKTLTQNQISVLQSLAKQVMHLVEFWAETSKIELTEENYRASSTNSTRKQLQNQIASLFKAEEALTVILQKLLKLLSEYGKYNFAEIWLASSDKKHLNLLSSYANDKNGVIFYEESTNVQKLTYGQGLPGNVWKSRKTEVWKNINTSDAFIRKHAAQKAGLQNAVGIPLTHNESFIGVIVFGGENKSVNVEFLKDLENFLGTEIKRKQQEEELNLLFSSAPDILAIASPNGHFTKVNPAFCKLLGYSEEELTTQPFANFIHPVDLNSTVSEYQETIKGERNANNFINRYLSREGSYKWISWNSSNVFGEDELVFAYGRDITEVITLQLLFENAAKMAKIGSWELDLKNPENKSMYWSCITRNILEVDENYNPSLTGGFEFYEQESKSKITAAIEKLIAKGETFDLELLLYTAKGNAQWVRCIGQSERYIGKCIKIFGSIQDIHALKTAEQNLKKALDEKNSILERITEAFFAVDNSWTVIYWNKIAELVLNKPKEKVIGNNLWEVFADALHLPSYKFYHQAMETGKTVSFEDYYQPVDKWFEISAYPSSSGLSVYFKDVSVRKLADEQIRLSNERFEKIADATNDAIWDYNVEVGTLFWGRGFSTLFGHDLNKVKPSFDLLVSYIHPDDRQRIIQKISQAMQDGITQSWFEEYRFLKANGSFAFVIDRAIFIRNNAGKVIRAVGAMTDISHRKEYEESLKMLNQQLKLRARELAQSNAELEQFAYVASHDLQEPLRMVASFLTHLEDKYSSELDEKARKYIFYAVDGAKRMKQIILDLLEFSRIGKIDEEKDTFNLSEIIDEICLLQRAVIQEKSAIIIKNNLSEITGYRVPVIQIFQNLIGNALKYAREDPAPVITISMSDTGTHWAFAVKDNGIGIKKEYFNKIFVLFQRLHDKNKFSGTGMGLAIVKKIVENLNGTIRVESEENVGTTFFFTLAK